MENFLNNRTNVHATSAPLEVPSTPNPNELAQEIAVEGTGEAPKVELVTEDGSIKRIIVNCTCGQCLELHCDY